MRAIITALLITAVIAAPTAALAQSAPGTGDLNNSCQVSTAQFSGNGLPVRTKVESTCAPGQECGAQTTVPAGTRGCAYKYEGALVWVSIPTITRGGVHTFDRVYLTDQLTGAN